MTMSGYEEAILEKKIEAKAYAYDHGHLPTDHPNSASMSEGRRDSIRKSFDQANLNMTLPDTTHLEVSEEDDPNRNSIDDIAASWFVWLVAATASIAGSLFGYDTGIISAVLVYLNDDLNNRPVSSGEKELITSLCSGGAFVGAIIAGLTADQVRSHATSIRSRPPLSY